MTMAISPITSLKKTNRANHCHISSCSPANYDRLYKGALNGLFPAEQVVSNRWSVRRSDLPQVATAFGLAPSSSAQASRAVVEHVTA